MRAKILTLILTLFLIFGLNLQAGNPEPSVLLKGFSLAIGQSTVNYMEQGGARWVIGGSLDVASGGDLDIESGAAFKIAGTDMTTDLGYLSSLTFEEKISIDFDDTDDGVVDLIDLSHTSSDNNATAGDGVGISVELENATGTSTVEEWFALDFKSTTITNGSEDGDFILSVMAGGTVVPGLTLDSSDQSLTLGANSTDADGIHQLRIFPVTASKGSLLFNAIANSDDYVVEVKNAAHGQTSAYTIPDCGNATGYFWTFTSTQTTAGSLKRADLTEEALAIYGIPVYSLRAADLADMGISETAGDHYLSLSANVIVLLSEVANNETETSVSYFQFILPPEYVAAGDVKIRVKHYVGGAGTSNNSTVDFEVYEQDGNGAVGADLCTTDATVTTEDSWTTTDFVVTAAGLVAGDILIIKFTSAVIENAVNNIQGKYDGFAVLLDIKG